MQQLNDNIQVVYLYQFCFFGEFILCLIKCENEQVEATSEMSDLAGGSESTNQRPYRVFLLWASDPTHPYF